MPVGGVMRKKFFPFGISTCNSATFTKTFFGLWMAFTFVLPAWSQSGRWKSETTDSGNKTLSGQDQPVLIPLPQDGRRSWTVRIEEVNGRQVAILESREVEQDAVQPSRPMVTTPQNDHYIQPANTEYRNERAIYPSAAPNRSSAAPSVATRAATRPAPAPGNVPTPSYAPAPVVSSGRNVGPSPNTSPILAYETSTPSDRLYTPPTNGKSTSGSPYEGRRWKVTAVSYGLASWYGGKYQGRRTANGEVFDMYQYTAAHRTIAFGSKVRVTNLANNKSVIVRINDRGPFTNDGRIIDLAMQAAEDIEMVRQGVGRVKLELLEEETGQYMEYTEVVARPSRQNNQNTAPQYPTIEQSQPERYTVQIAATGDAQRARMQANQVSGGWVHATQLNGNTLYRVNVGRYNTKPDAESAAGQIRNSGRDALVKQIQN